VANKENKIVIKNGRVIDPANGIDEITDIYIKDHTIERIGGRKNFQGYEVIDATDKIVIPGLVDMHVHLREPGNEESETIHSGARAAVEGGFTTICCMANTKPFIDNAEGVRFIYDTAADADCWVYPLAGVTKGLQGKELTEMTDIAYAGAIAFSDDGNPIEDGQLMRNALNYAKMLDMTITVHEEDKYLAQNGHMNEGEISGKLGMVGMPPIAESVMISRDLQIAEYIDAPLHICHVSTAKSVGLIREAKAKGIKVTAEVTPHHLILTDKSVADSEFDSNFKMNPPLRTDDDVKALREGIADGTIDAIATDHAPHALHYKDRDFNNAPFGIVGLETALGLILTELVHTKIIDIPQMIELMSLRPSQIYDLPSGTLSKGAFADITILDIDQEWTVDSSKFKSISRNTPFNEWKLKGRNVLTMVGGEVLVNRMK